MSFQLISYQFCQWQYYKWTFFPLLMTLGSAFLYWLVTEFFCCILRLVFSLVRMSSFLPKKRPEQIPFTENKVTWLDLNGHFFIDISFFIVPTVGDVKGIAKKIYISSFASWTISLNWLDRFLLLKQTVKIFSGFLFDCFLFVQCHRLSQYRNVGRLTRLKWTRKWHVKVKVIP